MKKSIARNSLSFGALVLSSHLLLGQTLVKDIEATASGSASSAPHSLTTVGSEVFFGARTRAGTGLWRTDGTAVGTGLVNTDDAQMIEALGQRVAIYAALTTSSFSNGVFAQSTLRRTDGTPAGTWTLPGPGGLVLALTRIGNEVAALFSIKDSFSSSVRYEVWATDGSVQRTRRIASFASATPVGFSRGELVAAGGRLYTAIRTRPNTVELWSAAGTATSFQMLASSSALRELNPLGDRVIFSAFDSGSGQELWISDGSVSGTFPADLEPGPTGSHPGGFLVAGSQAYFSAQSSTVGRELWTTDGTLAGTMLLADLNPGSPDSNPVFAGGLGGEAILSANVGAGQRLFAVRAGGSPRMLSAGSVRVDQGVASQAVLSGALLFAATGQDGSELWRTDGTAAGTSQVADIAPGSGSSSPAEFARRGGAVLFHAQGTNGVELWRTDGTTAGTRELVDLFPGSITGSSRPALAGKLGDRAYFTAEDAAGRELWVTDGTEAGTHMLIDLEPGPVGSSAGSFHFADDYFVFDATTSAGRQLWASDGTAAGTRAVGPASDPLEGAGTTASNEVVYSSGPDVRVTDGTPAGTHLLKSFGGLFRAAYSLTAWKGSVYFSVSLPGPEAGVWVTDGTTAGTRRVWDPSASGAAPGGVLAGLGDEVFFLSNGPSNLELWATDGTAQGTRHIGAVAPSSRLAVSPALAVDGRLFFFYRTSASETRLFVSDGVSGVSSASTPLQNLPTLFAAAGQGRVVYSERGGELWSSDGSDSGTFMIHPLSPGSAFSAAAVGNPGVEKLFLRAPSLFAVHELVTDGTATGTHVLPGGESVQPSSAGLRLGARFLYPAVDEQFGTELFSRPLSDFDDYAVEPYARGCGSAPSIELEGIPRASAAKPFSIVLSGAPAGAPAWLLSSPERAHVSLGACVLGLGSSLSIAATSTDAQGEARVSIAPSPALVDLKLDFQYAVLDPAGAYRGLSLSPALEVVGGL